MTAAPDTKITDWERIEAQYSAGSMSLREIAAEHGITEGAIRKRAKGSAIRPAWTRDLTAKVKSRADDLVRKALVKAERPQPPDKARGPITPTEAQVVEVEAEVQSRIRLEHRTDIQRSKRIVNNLMAHLEGLGLPPLPAADSDESEKQALRALGLGVLKDQAGVLDKLVTTQKSLVSMEREAFGIAQMVENPDEPNDIDPMDGARRLLFVLNRAAALNGSK